MRKLCALIFAFCYLCGQEARPTVCLNMIVKNERAVISRCLESAKNLIDYWVIIDTGSTDDTADIIQACMKDVPGELHHRPWVNFAHNRNEALKLSKGKADFVLFIDADEEFQLSPHFRSLPFDKDFYLGTVRMENGVEYQKIFLINNHMDWEWKGVLHEDVFCQEAKHFGHLEHVSTLHRLGGARSRDPQKHLKDIEILEKALLDEPQNSRYVFYLAESYLRAQKYDLALQTFEKRAAMGEWDQEVFWSLYNIACLQELLQMPSDIVIRSYSHAYLFRPSRAEPLYRLAKYLYHIQQPFLGYTIAHLAASLPVSQDAMNVEKTVYQFGILQEIASGAYYLGKFQEAKDACNKILALPDLPADVRQQTLARLSLLELK